MGIVVYLVHHLLNMIMGNTISTLLAIIIGVASYGVAIIFMKVLSKEDIMMIPFGTRVYPILVKFKIYKGEEPLE